jgi:hypothetical protein
MAAEWGGTAISDATALESVQSYVNSAARFRKIAADAKVDVILTTPFSTVRSTSLRRSRSGSRDNPIRT